jgi:hypothetical protein
LAARTGKGFGAAGKTGSFFLRRKEKAFFFRVGKREDFPAGGTRGFLILHADAPQPAEPVSDACRGTAAFSGTVRLAPPLFAARFPSVPQDPWTAGRRGRPLRAFFTAGRGRYCKKITNILPSVVDFCRGFMEEL